MNGFFNIKSGFAKVLLSGIMAASLLINSQPARAAAINDIDASSAYARESIIALAEQGVISGDGQGNFNPHSVITRSEMVKILVNVMGIDTTNVPQKPSFTDVPTTHWSYKYVEAAYREGIIKGLPDGSFGISQKLTREQMAAMFVRSIGLTDEILAEGQEFSAVTRLADEDKIGSWARGSVDFALSAGLMKGTDLDSFSPKASAERQQVAIVADRFIKNKTAIQEQAQAILAKIRVILNGDVINLGDKAFSENGKVFVPVKFFEKMGAKVEADSGMNTASISRKLSDGTDKSIIFGEGNNEGLKVVNNEVYVPLVAAAEALGANVQWKENYGTVSINDAETVKYPNLYNAINESMNFKGSFSSTGSMVMEGIIPDSILEIDFNINGELNGDNYRMGFKMTPKIDGIPDASESIDVIKVGEKVYVKLKDENEWVETTAKELEDSGLIPVDFTTISKDSNLILGDAYKLYNITKAGNVTIGGEAATKYILTVDEAAIKDMLSKTNPDGYAEAEELLNAGTDIKMEIYVNKDGQIVKETLVFNMKAEENGENTSITMKFDVSYSNIGKDIEITAPEAISDRTLDDILYGSL